MDAKQIARAKELIEQLCELAEWFPKKSFRVTTEGNGDTKLYQIQSTWTRFAVNPANEKVLYATGYPRYARVEVGDYLTSCWHGHGGRFIKALEAEILELEAALAKRRELIAKAMVAVWAAPLWPIKEWWDEPGLFYATYAWNTDRTEQVRLFTTEAARIIDGEFSYKTVALNITTNREVAVSSSWALDPTVCTIVSLEDLPDDYLEVIVRAFSAPHRPPGRGEGKRRR